MNRRRTAMAGRKSRKPDPTATPYVGPPYPEDPLPEGARVRFGTNRLNYVAQGGNPGVVRIAFSPNGKFLLGIGCHDVGSLWEVSSGREVWRREFGCRVDRGAGAAFSPDSRLLAIGCGTLKVFETITGRELRTLNTDGWCYDLAFSPCGRFLAEPLWGRVQVWAVDRWKDAGRLEGEPVREGLWGDQFNAVGFSQDGRYLAGGANGAVCLGVARRAVGEPLGRDNEPRELRPVPTRRITRYKRLGSDSAGVGHSSRPRTP
jgi:hypothetical protein